MLLLLLPIAMRHAMEHRELPVTGRSRLALPIKLVLLVIATAGLDVVSKRFKVDGAVGESDVREYLYFTNISLIYTFFCVFLGFFHKFSRRVTRVYYFAVSTAFVLELLVTVTFWILFTINPALVKNDMETGVRNGRPSILQELPKHGIPTVMLLLEHREIPFRKRMAHRIFLGVFCVLYYLVCEIYSYYSGETIYPFLKYFTWLQRVVFFVGMACIGLFVYDSSIFIRYGFGKRTRDRRRMAKMKMRRA